MNKNTSIIAGERTQNIEVEISIQGGVASVEYVPKGVTVRIRDYDNDENPCGYSEDKYEG